MHKIPAILTKIKTYGQKIYLSKRLSLSENLVINMGQPTNFAIFMVIFLLVAICYIPFYAPVLFYDDWFQFYFDNVRFVPWLDLGAVRPLGLAGQKLIYIIFGPYIQPFYIINILILTLNAYFFYKILSYVFPEGKKIIFVAAVLSFIYPADSSRMFTQMVAIRACALFGLFSNLALIQYLKNGKIRWLPIAAILAIFPIISVYEGSWGLSAALGLILLGAFIINRPIMQRFWIAVIYFMTSNIFIVLWRSIYPRILGIRDVRNETLSWDLPLRLLAYLSSGYKILYNSWVKSIESTLIYPYKISELLIAIAVFTFFFSISFILLWNLKENNITINPRHSIRKLLLIIITGILLTAAGYIPIIFIYEPNLYSFMSRVNYLAVWGASLVIAGVIGLIAQIYSIKFKWGNQVFLALLLPVLISASSTELRNQQETNLVWEKQVTLWQKVVTIAPTLKNGTTILIVADHIVYYTEDYAYLLDVLNTFDNKPRAQVLYNNSTIGASAITIDKSIINWNFTSEGIKYSYMGSTFYPYNDLIVLRYEQSKAGDNIFTLRIVDNLQEEFKLNFSPKGYSPREHIYDMPDQQQFKFRYLINMAN